MTLTIRTSSVQRNYYLMYMTDSQQLQPQLVYKWSQRKVNSFTSMVRLVSSRPESRTIYTAITYRSEQTTR